MNNPASGPNTQLARAKKMLGTLGRDIADELEQMPDSCFAVVYGDGVALTGDVRSSMAFDVLVDDAHERRVRGVYGGPIFIRGLCVEGDAALVEIIFEDDPDVRALWVTLYPGQGCELAPKAGLEQRLQSIGYEDLKDTVELFEDDFKRGAELVDADVRARFVNDAIERLSAFSTANRSAH